MRPTTRDRIRFTGLLLLSLLVGFGALAEDGWFVSFDRQQVTPVNRTDTERLIEVGTIETDGFSEMVLSLGCEYKESIPSSGTVGAILIPDVEAFTYLLRSEGQIVFPLVVEAQAAGGDNALFLSEQKTVRIAFPRYRVYMFNETSSGAVASLYAYRVR